MQHFVNYTTAEFGLTKRLNKNKKALVDSMVGLEGSQSISKNPMYREAINPIISSSEPNKIRGFDPSTLTEGRRVINRNYDYDTRSNLSSNPVKNGKPSTDYYVDSSIASRDISVFDKVEARNRKQILSNAKSKNGYGAVASSDLNTWTNEFMPDYTAKNVYDSALKEARNTRSNPNTPYTLKPALLAKSERLDFSPTTEQLAGILNKNYPDYKNYVNNPRDLLATGSPNHTWLTNSGKYMEMPIGQQEMPLDASMWKGRKSGMRMPPYEIKAQGEIGSPVLGIGGGFTDNITNKKRQINYTEGLKGRMIQTSNNYNNQIANKRYEPKE